MPKDSGVKFDWLRRLPVINAINLIGTPTPQPEGDPDEQQKKDRKRRRGHTDSEEETEKESRKRKKKKKEHGKREKEPRDRHSHRKRHRDKRREKDNNEQCSSSQSTSSSFSVGDKVDDGNDIFVKTLAKIIEKADPKLKKTLLEAAAGKEVSTGKPSRVGKNDSKDHKRTSGDITDGSATSSATQSSLPSVLSPCSTSSEAERGEKTTKSSQVRPAEWKKKDKVDHQLPAQSENVHWNPTFIPLPPEPSAENLDLSPSHPPPPPPPNENDGQHWPITGNAKLVEASYHQKEKDKMTKITSSDCITMGEAASEATQMANSESNEPPPFYTFNMKSITSRLDPAITFQMAQYNDLTSPDERMALIVGPKAEEAERERMEEVEMRIEEEMEILQTKLEKKRKTQRSRTISLEEESKSENIEKNHNVGENQSEKVETNHNIGENQNMQNIDGNEDICEEGEIADEQMKELKGEAKETTEDKRSENVEETQKQQDEDNGETQDGEDEIQEGKGQTEDEEGRTKNGEEGKGTGKKQDWTKELNGEERRNKDGGESTCEILNQPAREEAPDPIKRIEIKSNKKWTLTPIDDVAKPVSRRAQLEKWRKQCRMISLKRSKNRKQKQEPSGYKMPKTTGTLEENKEGEPIEQLEFEANSPSMGEEEQLAAMLSLASQLDGSIVDETMNSLESFMKKNIDPIAMNDTGQFRREETVHEETGQQREMMIFNQQQKDGGGEGNDTQEQIDGTETDHDKLSSMANSRSISGNDDIDHTLEDEQMINTQPSNISDVTFTNSATQLEGTSTFIEKENETGGESVVFLFDQQSIPSPMTPPPHDSSNWNNPIASPKTPPPVSPGTRRSRLHKLLKKREQEEAVKEVEFITLNSDDDL